MKFTKRMLVMTFLAVTAAVSTGFAYDYVCNGSQANCNTNAQYKCNADTQYNCNTNAQYNCNNNNTFVTILAKVIAVQTLIQEDAADIEDNMISTLKAYSTVYVL